MAIAGRQTGTQPSPARGRMPGVGASYVTLCGGALWIRHAVNGSAFKTANSCPGPRGKGCAVGLFMRAYQAPRILHATAERQPDADEGRAGTVLIGSVVVWGAAIAGFAVGEHPGAAAA